MIDVSHSMELIVTMTVVTAGLRFLPFVLFPAGKQLPRVLLYLGRVLPGAVMAMLVVYCFKDTVILKPPYALPEIIATVLVSVIYWTRGSVLQSIGLGTICYMVLVQSVFC